MAVYRERDGNKTRYRIQFYDRDNQRRSIRLRGATRKGAEEINRHVERLNSSAISGEPVPNDTAHWVAGLGNDMHEKLARVELVQPRTRVVRETLKQFVQNYIAHREDAAVSTVRLWNDALTKRLEFFGDDRRLDQVSAGDADRWVQSLVNKGYSPATISKLLKRAKQFFRAARRQELISRDPFVDLKPAGERNPDRQHFVSREVTAKVLDAAPDAQWRLLIALVRYGGLRNPSETLKLEWSHIDWATMRMTITSPKTKRHGKGYRVAPIFPELVPYLEDAHEMAPPDARYVIHRYRGAGTNLRTQFERIIRMAGVEKWPRLFHNMRASRQTELNNEFPPHVVADWLGNTVSVADAHYLMTTEEHIQRAIAPAGRGATAGAEVVQKPVPQEVAASRSEPHGATQVEMHQQVASITPALVSDCEMREVPPVGLEPSTL